MKEEAFRLHLRAETLTGKVEGDRMVQNSVRDGAVVCVCTRLKSGPGRMEQWHVEGSRRR